MIYLRRELELEEEEEEEDDAVRGRMRANRNSGVDRRRLFQPPLEQLDEVGRQYMTRTGEEHLSAMYVTPIAPEGGVGAVVVKRPRMWVHLTTQVPPPLPGAPKSRRSPLAPGKPLHDQFYAPPLALSDCVRAADPVDRNYMVSEKFAILMWYVRTIPYCGSEPTADGRPKERGDYSAYRWNWARTHGVVLRPLVSIHEHWRRHVIKYFCGTEDLPAGSFRHYAANSGLFEFVGNRIVGFNMVAIRNKNAECLRERDINVKLDPYTLALPEDQARYAQLMQSLSDKHGLNLHQGQRWADAGNMENNEEEEEE